jgi:hypothetical protein
MIKKLFRKRIHEILDRFENSEIILTSETANFFGQHSKGIRQIRGNGVLLFMNSLLFFEMWHPKKILEIPLTSIKHIEVTKSFLGKSRFRDLLKISFINLEGERDEAAWLVDDLENWVSTLKNVLKL